MGLHKRFRKGDITSFDFARLEARAVAYFSKECVDPHLKSAADYYGIPVSEVTEKQRSVAKQVYYMEAYRADRGRIKCLWETNRNLT